jgi:hypothetical protein
LRGSVAGSSVTVKKSPRPSSVRSVR